MVIIFSGSWISASDFSTLLNELIVSGTRQSHFNNYQFGFVQI